MELQKKKKNEMLIIEVHVIDHYPEESLKLYFMVETKNIISVLSLNTSREILETFIHIFNWEHKGTQKETKFLTLHLKCLKILPIELAVLPRAPLSEAIQRNPQKTS